MIGKTISHYRGGSPSGARQGRTLTAGPLTGRIRPLPDKILEKLGEGGNLPIDRDKLSRRPKEKPEGDYL